MTGWMQASALVVWWLIGTVAVVGSMRKAMDVTVPVLAMAMVLGMLGPFIAIWVWIVDRNFVILRQKR